MESTAISADDERTILAQMSSPAEPPVHREHFQVYTGDVDVRWKLNSEETLKVMLDMRGDVDREDAQGQVERQARPGTHHGHGGRRRRPNAMELGRIQKEQIGHVLVTTLVNCVGGRLKDIPVLVTSLWASITDLKKEEENDGDAQSEITMPLMATSKLTSYFKSMLCIQPRQGYEVLPGPVLGICSKSAQNVQIGVGNVMERHTACTWIDWKGGVHCTCIGSTRHRVVCSTRHAQEEYINGGIQCNHVDSFTKLLQTLAEAFEEDRRYVSESLSRVASAVCATSFSQLSYSLPQVHTYHKSTVFVVAMGQTGDPHSIHFVPVRRVRKGKVIRHVCAYCDLGLRQFCIHTQTVDRLGTVNIDENDYHATEDESISHLP